MFPKYIKNLLFTFFVSIMIGVAFGLNFLSAIGQSSQPSGTSRILATDEIRIGIRRDSGPYGYEQNGECCVGFDVDIANELATRWNKTPQFVPVQASERIPLLEKGDLDLVIAAMTHSKARDEKIDFSQSYFRDGLQLLVRRDSGISGIDDLGGLRVGGVISTTGLTWATEQSSFYSFTVEPPFSLYNEAVNALIANDIDALISDGGILSFRTKEFTNTLTVVGEPFTNEFYGIGMPQGDSTLRELVNYTLQAMKEDGKYDEIYKKWFGDNDPFPIEVVPGEKSQKLEEYNQKAPLLESSRIDNILQAQKVIIGVPATKGLPADIAREFTQRWLGDPAMLELRVVTTQTGISAVINGEIDLAINELLPTWSVDQDIDFSQTYAAMPVALLTYQNANLRQLTDLRDEAIAFVANTPYQPWVESEITHYNLRIKRFSGYEAAINALRANEVMAVVGDPTELSFDYDLSSEFFLVENFYTIPYAISVPEGDFRLRELVNFTLQTMKEDGFYDCLYKKWFPQNTPYAIEKLPGNESYLPLGYQNPEEGRECLPKSTIEQIRERGNVMRVGTQADFPPMGFINENGEWVGFDLDLIRAMAEVWGIEVEFVKVLSDQRIPLLVAGEVDLVAASMTHTRQRDTQIDFSQNYFLDGQSLLTRAGVDIVSPLDLGGKRVGAIGGTTGLDGITAFKENKGLQFEIVSFNDNLSAIDALKNGTIEAFTTDRVVLLQFAKENPALAVVGEPFSSEPYGLGLPTGDSQFRFLVDITLQQLKDNGQYNKIYDKWFPGLKPYDVEILPFGKQPLTATLKTVPSAQPVLSPSVIEKMQKTKKLVAGVIDEFAPFGNLDANNECCVGFDIDIIKEFAKRWLGADSEDFLEFVSLKTDQRIPALVNGEVDIVAAAMTHNWERDTMIDFSQTYFLDGQSLLVRKGSGINGLNDLQKKRVGSATGSTSIEQIKEYAQKNGIEISIFPFTEHKLGVEALLAGQIDVYTTDMVALLQFAKENADLLVVGEPFTREPYGIGIPENDYQFRDLVNSTLQEMQLDGTYERLYQKWFGAPLKTQLEIWPKGSYAGDIGFSQAPMVHIPAGEFLRGNPEGEKDEQPAKSIHVDAFYIDQYEVTTRLYRECVVAGVCTRPQELFSLGERGDYYNNLERYGNYPVIWVTWEQANRYCKFLGKRLPTEAQWEKAARGPQVYFYPWGNELRPEIQASFAHHIDTAAIGFFALDVSGYQVYDTAGNVREWVNDFYDPNYYKLENPNNPIGPRKAVRKVVRGGSWITSQANLWRVTSREGYNPASYANNLGFRCASNQPPIQLVPAN